MVQGIGERKVFFPVVQVFKENRSKVAYKYLNISKVFQKHSKRVSGTRIVAHFLVPDLNLQRWSSK